MANNNRWCIQTLSVTNAIWTDIVCPSIMFYGCSRVIIRFDDGVLIIGNKDNPNEQDTLQPTVQEVIGSGVSKNFSAGDLICSIKAQTTGGNVKVRFVL